MRHLKTSISVTLYQILYQFQLKLSPTVPVSARARLLYRTQPKNLNRVTGSKLLAFPLVDQSTFTTIAQDITLRAVRAANIFSSCIFAPWAVLLWLGIDLTQGVAARHIPGYPNASQIGFSICTPASLVTLLLVALVVFNFVRRSPFLLAMSAGVATFLLFPYLYVFAAIAAI